MFTPSNMLKKYMNSTPRDIYGIVGALIGYINADPQFKTDTFKQAVQFVLDSGVSREKLYDEFNPEYELNTESSMWDEDYYSLARVYLKDNFCEKRIRHVEEVAHKIYGTGPSASQNSISTGKDEVGKYNNDISGGDKSNVKKTQDQQQIKANQEDAKISGLIISVVCVLLVIVIAFIIINM